MRDVLGKMGLKNPKIEELAMAKHSDVELKDRREAVLVCCGERSRRR